MTDEQKALKKMAHDFVEKEIRPNISQWDENRIGPDLEMQHKMAKLGLLGINLPEEYGGQGLTYFETVLVMEEFARVSTAWTMPILEANLGPIVAVDMYGTEKQKKKYFPPTCSGDATWAIGMTEPEAGSALTDLKTKAVPDGDYYIVNGQKRFCTGAGHSDFFMVYVRFGDVKGVQGIGALIIEKGTPGFTFGEPEHFMGLNGYPSGDLILEDVRVPKENLVVKAGEFKKLMTAFDVERLGNTTMALGIAQGALEEAIKYSKERKAWGKEICEFQAIQLMLADMSLKTEASRLLLYRAATEASIGSPSMFLSSLCKCFANEICKEVADLALQIFGGYGYSKEYPIERLLRDSRGWQVAGGTLQMQKINIASALVGRRFDQRK